MNYQDTGSHLVKNNQNIAVSVDRPETQSSEDRAAKMDQLLQEISASRMNLHDMPRSNLNSIHFDTEAGGVRSEFYVPKMTAITLTDEGSAEGGQAMSLRPIRKDGRLIQDSKPSNESSRRNIH